MNAKQSIAYFLDFGWTLALLPGHNRGRWTLTPHSSTLMFEFTSLQKVWRWWSMRIRRSLAEEACAKAVLLITGIDEDDETLMVHRWIESNGRTELPCNLQGHFDWPYFNIMSQKHLRWKKHAKRLAHTFQLDMNEYQFSLLNEAMANLRRNSMHLNMPKEHNWKKSTARL